MTTVRARNPVKRLPSFQALMTLGLVERRAVRAVLMDLGTEADRLAEHSWKKRKGPMAAYWRAVGVYARHIARAVA